MWKLQVCVCSALPVTDWFIFFYQFKHMLKTSKQNYNSFLQKNNVQVFVLQNEHLKKRILLPFLSLSVNL